MSEYPDPQTELPKTEHAQTEHPPRPGLISSGSAPVANRVSEVWADAAETQAAAQATTPLHDQPTVRLELSDAEARVLGALVEKSFLTPDVYPMTTNALATACNQKTNRDPVVDYAAVLIDSTLLDLRQRNLVRRVHSQGSRSTKHRQTLDEVLALNKRELALASVLLLRGPQTMGELRLRTERHDVGFDDLDSVEDCLHALADRAVPLVEMLPRQAGHKENRWQHLLGDPRQVPTEDAAAAASAFDTAPAAQTPQAPSPSVASPSVASPRAPSPSVASPSVASDQTRAATDGLVTRVAELEAEVAVLRRQLAGLAAKLGEPLD